MFTWVVTLRLVFALVGTVVCVCVFSSGRPYYLVFVVKKHCHRIVRKRNRNITRIRYDRHLGGIELMRSSQRSTKQIRVQ